MPDTIIDPRADLISIIEAAYAPEPGDVRWSAELVGAAQRAILCDGIGLAAVVHGDGYVDRDILLSHAAPSVADAYPQMLRVMIDAPADAFHAAFYPRRPAVMQSELSPELPANADRTFRDARRSIGAADVLGVFGHPRPGVVAVLWATMPQQRRLHRGDRRVLHRIAGHLDGALRLRLGEDPPIAAVISPEGALLDVADAPLADRRALLASRVDSIERSRLRGRRRDEDALDLWEALVDGRYTLVPREDSDRKRFYLALVNPPIAQAHARFSAREAAVLRLSARGFSGKEASYALGIAPSAVSRALASAAIKVGFRSRDELVHVSAALFAAGPRRLEVGPLTDAERAIAELVRRGLSNDEIARLRGRSPRTVANQMAAILLKTGATGRRALFTRCKK